MDAAEAFIQEASEIRLFGGVEIVWGEYEARVDRAVYRRSEGSITSDAPVDLVGPGLSVQGRGVEVDVEGRVAKIMSEVRAVVGGGSP